ncbi:MAG: prepilin-type N-terminal cleavage/methylation domain-containing protein [Bacillota bacterium]
MLNKNEGFTLIEIMVCLIVSGVLIMGFSRLAYIIEINNIKNEQYFQVMNSAQSLIECVRQLNLSELTGEYTPGRLLQEIEQEEVYDLINEMSLNNSSLITIKKACPAGQAYPGLYQLKSIIEWEDGERRYELITYVFQK